MPSFLPNTVTVPDNTPVPDQTSTADRTEPQTPNQESPQDVKRWREFRERIDICKLYRRKLIANWSISIDYRRGKPFASQTDEDQIAVNLDWTYTKAKQALLFSQVPQVRIDHPPQTIDPQILPWLTVFEQKLNDTIVDAGIEAAMEECLPDCINAAGIGIILVAYEAITQDKQVPSTDLGNLPPDIHAQVLQTGLLNGQSVPMETVPFPVDYRYTITRISPADLLWPIQFTGSNFDSAPWIGRSGRLTWAEAAKKYNLTEADKEQVLGEDRTILDRLTHDVERDKVTADDVVGFDEIFYKEFQYNVGATSYNTYHHLVFINGKDKPVVDGPWEGQKLDSESNKITGCKKAPIRVLTLSYMTDETIPPSDSAIGRPQVNEINKARTQMIRQRERSLPVRTVDVNRVDPTVVQSLMRGTWQAFIPIQGDGSRAISEVSRAAMPQENFMFDKIAKSDLNELWTVDAAPGMTPEGGPGAEPPVGQPASTFQTRIGRERAKVASFFVGVAECLAGLMCLYEDPQSFGQGFSPEFSQVLTYSVLADSTVLVDANQRLARLDNFLNKYAKSGWINLQSVFAEIASLTGLDPSVVITQPQPKPPVEPNISLRLTGVEDLLNPMALAVLLKSGQAPSADLIEQAKQLIQASVVPPQGMQMPGQPLPPGGLPMLPAGGPPPNGPVPPGQAGPSPIPPAPAPPPPKPGEANPHMGVMPSLDKRSEPGGRQ